MGATRATCGACNDSIPSSRSGHDASNNLPLARSCSWHNICRGFDPPTDCWWHLGSLSHQTASRWCFWARPVQAGDAGPSFCGMLNTSRRAGVCSCSPESPRNRIGSFRSRRLARHNFQNPDGSQQSSCASTIVDRDAFSSQSVH